MLCYTYVFVSRVISARLCGNPIWKLVADFWKPLIVQTAKWISDYRSQIVYCISTCCGNSGITYKPFRMARLLLWFIQFCFPEKRQQQANCPCVTINSIPSLTLSLLIALNSSYYLSRLSQCVLGTYLRQCLCAAGTYCPIAYLSILIEIEREEDARPDIERCISWEESSNLRSMYILG